MHRPAATAAAREAREDPDSAARGVGSIERSVGETSRLRRALPFLRWWPRVDRRSLRGDLVAGLTGAIVVLPQGVAFATIAGLPPEYGLYSAMVPAVIAALFGSSWHLVSGPTTAISIVVFAVVSPLAEPGSAPYVSLVLTLTFMVGVMQLSMGLARLGTLVNFVSHTVVVAFTAGAAILIATSQLKNFLGVEVPRGASFQGTLRAVAQHARDVDPWVVSVGLVTLLTGILVKRYARRVPYMIAAMVAGSVAGVVVDRLGGAGHIRTVGALPAMLPPLSVPSLSPEIVTKLAGAAFAVTMLALTEAVSIARAIAMRSEQRIDGNQEFIGQGLANVVGSFFSSYASSGSFNRSGLNYDAGARTPLAAALASLFLAAIVLLVAPLAAYLPIAAMAAILFLVARGLVDLRQMRSIVKADRAEAAILFTTFFSTLFLDLELAIYAGVILSLVVYLNRTSRPPVHTLVPDPVDGRLARSEGLAECAQIRIVDVHGSLFFGAVDHVQAQLEALDAQGPRQRHVLLVAEGINFADLPGAEMLVREARRRRRAGGGLYLVGLKPRTLEALRAGGHLEEIGEENVFDDVTRAIAEIRGRVDPAVCEACSERVFSGCARPAAPSHEARRPTGIDAAMTAAALAEGGDLDGARRIMAGRTAEPGPAGRAGAPADLAGRARTGPRRGPAKP